MNYDSPMVEKSLVMATSPMQEPTINRLEREKKHLEDRLSDVNKAIQMLKENPKLEEFHEALRRV